MRITDYFDRTFIINLPSRADRRRDTIRELANIGVHLRPRSVEIFPALRPAAAEGFGTIGAHGCFRSHLAVLERAQAEGVERLLIMEDDFTASPHFRRDEEAVVAQLSSTDWGIVYLGHGLWPVGEARATLKPHAELIMLSHCYGLARPTFEPLIAFMEAILTRPPGHSDGGPMSHDGAMWEFRRRHPEIITLVTEPNLAQQRSSRSDLSPNWFDDVPVLAQAASVARRVKVRLTR